MTKSVGGLFDKFEDAQRAVDNLVERGFNTSDISLIAQDAMTNYSQFVNVAQTERIPIAVSEDAVSAGEGAGFGAVVGAVTGVLAGLAAITIPGLGAIVALGPVVGALTGGTLGAVTGAAVGGVVAAIVKSGFSEEEAHRYAEGIRRGSALVIVQATDGQAFLAQDILLEHGAIDLAKRTLEWESEGWRSFDADAAPYRTVHPYDKVDNGNNEENLASSIADTPLATPAVTNAPAPTSYLDDTARHKAINTADLDTKDLKENPSTLRWGMEDELRLYDGDFRQHHLKTYNTTGYAYDLYYPSYRYGYELAANPRYTDSVWAEVEPQARQEWVERYPEGEWEMFSGAVQYGWDRTRQTR